VRTGTKKWGYVGCMAADIAPPLFAVLPGDESYLVRAKSELSECEIFLNYRYARLWRA